MEAPPPFCLVTLQGSVFDGNAQTLPLMWVMLALTKFASGTFILRLLPTRQGRETVRRFVFPGKEQNMTDDYFASGSLDTILLQGQETGNRKGLSRPDWLRCRTRVP